MVHFFNMSGKIRVQTVSALLKEAAKQLKPAKMTCVSDQELGWLEAEILMAHTLKKDRAWVVTHGTDELVPSLEKRFRALVERRLASEPIAYITGVKDFYGRPFAVNRTVLIPRPETELMIDALKERYQKNDTFTIWDTGTGSGAIAITVALEFPRAFVIASDICKRALKTATKNAIIHGVTKRVTFIHGDLLSPDIKQIIEKGADRGARGAKKSLYPLPSPHSPLIVLANLPYLPESDRTELAKDVTAFEPAKALYAGEDGLDVIRKLFTQISDELNVNPKLILAEFDPPQAKTIQKLAKEIFPLAKISIRKDLAGRERMLEIRMR
jgi:release factor glutamine methyltransferase